MADNVEMKDFYEALVNASVDIESVCADLPGINHPNKKALMELLYKDGATQRFDDNQIAANITNFFNGLDDSSNQLFKGMKQGMQADLDTISKGVASGLKLPNMSELVGPGNSFITSKVSGPEEATKAPDPDTPDASQKQKPKM